jgi:hypothetical protein
MKEEGRIKKERKRADALMFDVRCLRFDVIGKEATNGEW